MKTIRFAEWLMTAVLLLNMARSSVPSRVLKNMNRKTIFLKLKATAAVVINNKIKTWKNGVSNHILIYKNKQLKKMSCLFLCKISILHWLENEIPAPPYWRTCSLEMTRLSLMIILQFFYAFNFFHLF